MIIFFEGWGTLVGLFLAGLILLALDALTGSSAFSGVVAGLFLAAYGFFFNFLGEERWRLFLIPIQYWGLLLTLGSLLGSDQ